jgi:uncharacterized protein YdhG (YjbR/CyaY superfamily)
MPASTVADYLEQLPADRRPWVERLLQTLRTHLPPGFTETISYGMPAFVVGHERYPAGYHCDPKLPLPFISIGSQKAAVTIYHMGLYADGDLLRWFEKRWVESGAGKLDMGKSCVRFKKPEQVPWGLLEDLAGRMTPDDWVSTYERAFKR